MIKSWNIYDYGTYAHFSISSITVKDQMTGIKEEENEKSGGQEK